MDATSMRWGEGLWERARSAEWSGVSLWALSFGLVLYLGLRGGGYDALVHDEVGVIVWWGVLALVLAGALPRLWPTGLAWVALGLLAALTAWTALSLGWTESTERTWADLARLAGFLGVFALALFAAGAEAAHRIVGGVAAAAATVAAVGLLSRLHPAWFPEATQTAELLDNGRERLSYPLNYWNGLAALIAIGVPCLLAVATAARSLALRAVSAAALPAMGLAAFFTFSRAGIGAAFLALAVFVAFAPNRLPKLLSLLVAGAGTAVLVGAALQRDALEEGFLDSATARQQGDELLLISILVCVAVGVVQAMLSTAPVRELRPAWTRVSARQATVAAAAVLVALLAVGVAADAPSRASDAWSEFKEAEEGPGNGAGRLGSAAGESRYDFWTVAVDQNAADPLKGTGSGTFEFWWTRNSDGSGTVRDAHSLYMQTLGELGVVGLALLVAFLLVVLVGGGRAALAAQPRERSMLAAALAGCVAFCLGATFDWLWQIPALTVAMLLLAAALLAAGGRAPAGEPTPLSMAQRLGIAAVALAAIVAIAIPLASTSQLRQSEAAARAGDFEAALEHARSAQNVEPGAMSPRLQRALILETMGDLGGAALAAREATDREPANWRPWLVLSRIEARRGRAAPAVRAYRRARSLNPLSPLFDRDA
ncbi:MAG TPA: O-antigen ligase family protein [Solirubrobacterales bacterium]|nr:O-antigen ligase family protein [Solirubrobacterales bacterium]